MSDKGQEGNEVAITPPEVTSKQLTNQQKMIIQKNRFIAFNPPTSKINIPILNEVKKSKSLIQLHFKYI